MSITYAEAGPLCCSKAEKDILRQALLLWRNSYWVKIRNDYPFFSRDWVITNENIGHLVDKAHILLNTPQVDVAIVRSLIKCISDDMTMTSLVCVLQEFCDMWREQDLEERNNRCYDSIFTHTINLFSHHIYFSNNMLPKHVLLFLFFLMHYAHFTC